MPHPLLYEINTRCWLRDLSQKNSAPVTLANVPDSEFATWKHLGFTHIWLMGVWRSGLLARAEALRFPGQRQAYSDALPDWTQSDVEGSPYAIADYRVPANLGGDESLAAFRRKLNAHGLKLILDFVPNHLGLDHPWINQFPDLFVQAPIASGVGSSPSPEGEAQGTAVALSNVPEIPSGSSPSPPSAAPERSGGGLEERVGERKPFSREHLNSMEAKSQAEGSFLRQTHHGLRLLAHGKDPNFPAWTDTIQLDYRRPETHAKMLEVLHTIANRCDGVRCDMAMLILPEVFTQTWSWFPVSINHPPSTINSFWPHTISSIKSLHPSFLFLAEAYWRLETELQAQGFDFTYDKELYDRLVARDAAGVQRHLFSLPSPSPFEVATASPLLEERAGERSSSSASVVFRGAHFLENHDERRIASVLSAAEHRAAALVILGLPGMRFLHEGQLTGACRRLPVQLTRRCVEPPLPEVAQIYDQLLAAIQLTSIGRGRAELLKPRPAWTENPTAENFILIQWQSEPGSFDLVAVNLASHQGQCYAPLTIANLSTHDWRIRDLLTQNHFTRPGPDLQSQGLYLDLPANSACIFHFAH